MSIYGEGLYRDADGGAGPEAASAALAQLKRGDWELLRRATGEALTPVPTPETKTPSARVGLRAVEVRPGAACA